MSIVYRYLSVALLAVLLATPSAVAQDVTLKKATHSEILDAVAQNDTQVTVVNFWATWCVPCIEEFPHFVKLGEKFAPERVQVMFVSADFPGSSS